MVQTLSKARQESHPDLLPYVYQDLSIYIYIKLISKAHDRHYTDEAQISRHKFI